MKIALIGRFGEGEIIPGPDRVARELYDELKQRNDVVFIEYFFGNYNSTTLRKKIIGKETAVFDRRVLRLGILPLIMTLLKENFDIVHLINSQRFLLFILIAKGIFKSKLIGTLHGFLRYELNKDYYFRKKYFIDLMIEKLIINKSDLVVFPSTLLFETFDKEYNIPRNRYTVIPNGIGKTFASQTNLFPAIENSLKFVFNNGLSSSIDKGLLMLTNLLAKVDINIQIFVIGREEHEINPTGKVKIFFEGFLNQRELESFLKDKHFIIKADAFESFGIFVAECMALGLIPIINNNIGIKDFITHGTNGFKYNISVQADLLNLLADIYIGKFDLNLISRNAKKIYDELNWAKVSKQYNEVYRTLL